MPTRRLLLRTLAPLLPLLVLPGCGTLLGPDEVLIPRAQLETALAKQLPQHFSAGLFELDARLGRLQLLPQEEVARTRQRPAPPRQARRPRPTACSPGRRLLPHPRAAELLLALALAPGSQRVR